MKTIPEIHAAFWRDLAGRLKKGEPLVRSLRAVTSDMSDKDMVDAITQVGDAIEKGNTFSESLRKVPAVFTACDAMAIEVGEATGELEKLAAQLGEAIADGNLPRADAARSDDPMSFWPAMYVLLNMGIPVMRVLDLLAEDMAGPRLREAISTVKDGLMNGKKLSEAMRADEEMFPSLICNVISDGQVRDDVLHAVKEVADAYREGRDLRELAGVTGEQGEAEEPVVKLVKLILAECWRGGATDIHIEHDQDSLQIRERVDGVMHELNPPPVYLAPAIMQRFKLMAKVDITDKRHPQDGRFAIRLGGKSVDFRACFLPTATGCRTTLRILDPARICIDLDSVGMSADNLASVRDLIRQPSGLILVTGPTGAGKTTLMYSMLNEINREEQALFTAEDPVEFAIDGISQIQIQPAKGMTFARTLRAILRQDPNVIMIGEIRDFETAMSCVQAVMTGHLVIAGMHAMTAAEAVRRLLDMGLDTFMVNSALAAVINTRLVRQLCVDCSKGLDLGDIELTGEASGIIDSEAADLRAPVGCSKCHETGYRGRQLLSELLIPTDELIETIASRSDAEGQREAVKAVGMRTMLQDGLIVAAEGRTSLVELIRNVPYADKSILSVPIQPPVPGPVTDAAELVEPDSVLDDAQLEELEALDLMTVTGENAPIKIVNRLFVHGVKAGASDVHIEPFQKSFFVRFRVDGVLRKISDLPREHIRGIIDRVKVLAGLDVVEKRLPQDGRISIRISDGEYDMRVSTLPSIYGEKIVIRILDRARIRLDLARTGVSEDMLPTVQGICRLPFGLILINGPTGTGKTTLMYSMLNEINTPERAIITIEDPVEYSLKGVSQVSVNAAAGLTFTNLMRSVLRSAPNVIMLGEIRDFDSLNMAACAAMTGHLVLSSLHAATSAGAIERVTDIGLERFLISSSLAAVITPRLVRKLCPSCRERVDGTQLDARAAVEMAIDGLDSPEFYKAVGCADCQNTGYRGRTAVLEILNMTDQLRSVVLSGGGRMEIQEAAIAGGMRTLLEAGVRKAAQGITSLEEVLRVIPAVS